MRRTQTLSNQNFRPKRACWSFSDDPQDSKLVLNHFFTGLGKIHTLFQLNIISINPRNHWKCSGISVKKHLTKHVSFCYLKTFLYEKNNFKLCTFLARNYFFGKIKSNYLSFSTLNINLYPGDPRSQKKCLFLKDSK